MAAIDYDVVRVTANFTTTSASYTNVTNATIPSTDFTSGRKYLLVVTAHFGGDDANANFGLKLQHGSTDFAPSEHIGDVSSATTTNRASYCWFTVWTAVASEAIQLQAISDGSNTIHVDQIVMVKIEISEDLTENTDWHFNDVTASTALATSTWSTTNNASVTFTPGTANDKWLVMATCRIDNMATVNNSEARIQRSGEASHTAVVQSREGEDTAGDNKIFTLITGYQLGASSNTFTQQVQRDGGGGSANRSYSAVFVLNMSKFDAADFSYTETETTLSTTDYNTELESVAITPSTTTDVWVVGFFVGDINVNTTYKGRIQSPDGTDEPTTQTSDGYNFIDAYDNTDEMPVHFQGVRVGQGASSLTSVLDASTGNTSAVAEDSFLMAMTFELAGGAPPAASNHLALLGVG
jgi:hypothetical protein